MATMTPLSALDAALLAAETPTQHLHVVATMIVDQADAVGSAFEIFQTSIAERHRIVEPLRRRLQSVPFGDPVWVDAPDLHLPSHLRHVHLAGGGLDAVARVVGEIASTPLHRDRPLWEAWLIEGFDGEDRVAVVAKVHHAAIDGVSGFDALAAFFDLEAQPSTPLWVDDWEPAPRPSTIDLVRRAVTAGATQPRDAVRAAARIVGSVRRMAPKLGGDAPAPLTAPKLSFNRALRASRAASLTTMSLDDVKTVRRAFGVTVNDVVLAVTAGGLRRYLLANDELPDRPIVAGVPVSERLPEHGASGNRFSAMLCALPVQLEDPVARIEAAARSAGAAKDAHAAGGVGALSAIAEIVPPRAIGPIMRVLSGLRVADAVPPVANVIVSNVRGPEFPLYLAGSRVEHVFPMGPLVEGTGLGMTVVSYRDRLGVGLLACPELLPDLDSLASALTDELALLVEVAARA